MGQNWQNQRVLIIGAARQGLALARYLSQEGAQVVLNDKRPAEQLQKGMDLLKNYPIEWALGDHSTTLLDGVGCVCLSGGVPPELPIVLEAVKRGIPVSNDTQVFLDNVPCPVTAITGSAGKTTTTTLVGKIAEKAIVPPQKAWVGGNIGLPLIDKVDQINKQDTVILELSSFQLEWVTRSPHIAAILNITPNHLDRHGTIEAYTAAKARILDFQNKNDISILSRDDPGSWKMKRAVKGQMVSFGINKPAQGENGTYCENGTIYYQNSGRAEALMPIEIIKLRGSHNVQNVLAACCISSAMQFSKEAMQAAVSEFGGIPHRLEFVRRWNGADWYNDSIATAPERTIAAIHSFNEPLVLLLGGRDKKLPWEELAILVHQRVKHLVIFGEASDMIRKAVGSAQSGETLQTINQSNGLEEAVQIAGKLAGPGDVVLLSPGGTSFDAFKDFEERGERYRLWVNSLS